MTQVITISNQKGGVGKTTTASALITGLHQRGARVLGVDLDPQGNLGFTLGLEIGAGFTTYDVLSKSHSIFECISSTEHGDVIPSDVLLRLYISYIVAIILLLYNICTSCCFIGNKGKKNRS